MLILDLDNTIFETNSIGENIFEPIVGLIQTHYNSINQDDKASQILDELWSKPMDMVFEKHNTPHHIRSQAFKKINEIDFRLEIKTYDDYGMLKSFENEMILVTTGYKKLQQEKINALKIRSDFKEVYIDDPSSNSRKYKIGIFREILQRSELKADEIWVIGDGVENEISAAKEIGMNTIQRLKQGIMKSELSDYGIRSFHELKNIIK